MAPSRLRFAGRFGGDGPSSLPTSAARARRGPTVSTARRRKPLATFEYGTRVYAPSEGQARYRVVATGADGRRTFFKTTSEKVARERARDIETRLASSIALPGRANAPASVSTLLGHANAAFTLSRYVGVRGDLAATASAATDGW